MKQSDVRRWSFGYDNYMSDYYLDYKVEIEAEPAGKEKIKLVVRSRGMTKTQKDMNFLLKEYNADFRIKLGRARGSFTLKLIPLEVKC